MDRCYDNYPLTCLCTGFIKCEKEQRSICATIYHRQPRASDHKKMKPRHTIWPFAILAFILPLTCFALYDLYEKNWKQLPILISSDHHISNFILTNQDARKFELDSVQNKIIITDFFFSHCPSICPVMTKNMQSLQSEMKIDTALLFLSISVDPERDSSEQLKNYCNQRKIDNYNWHFLTGQKQMIYKLARNSFRIVATDGDGGPSDFIHSEKFVLLDKLKRIRGYYDGTNKKDIQQLIIDIKKLKNEK
jgi:protein SCO1/2